MAEQETNTAWEPQEDGTFLPSAALVEKIRANPQEFPNAAKDLSVMSGKSEEEVQAILDNQQRAGGTFDRSGLFNAPQRMIGAAIEGLGQAAGWATQNTAELAGGEDAKEIGDAIKSATNFDPSFETEEGTAENVAEFAGQVAPAVVAGVATGGAGLVGFLTGAAAGGAVGTATFNPREKTLVDLIDEYVPLGPVQDALQINPEDSTGTAMLKQFAAGGLVEAAAGGAIKVVGKIGAAITKGNLEEAVKIAEDAGIKVDGVDEGVEAAAPKVTPKEAEAEKVAPEVTGEVLRQDAAAAVRQVLDEEAVGQALPKLPVDPKAVKAFETDIMRTVKAFEARTAETTNLSKIDPSVYTEFRRHSAEVYTAIRGGDIDQVIKLVKQSALLKGQLDEATANIASVYRDAMLKSTLARTSDMAGELVMAVRADPSLRTRGAILSIANRQLNQVSELWDIYRNTGTAASYKLKLRQGVMEGVDELGEIAEVNETILKELRKDGIGLYDDKGTFVAKKIIALDDVGINPVDLLDDLFKQFDEFDAMAAGKRDNIKQARKLTPVEKMGGVALFMQRVKDIQAVMLLGQIMTAATEIVSTGSHLILLPALRKLGGGPGSEWLKEYAGYAHAWEFSRAIWMKAFKAGAGVLDDFDIKEGTKSTLEYADINNPMLKLGWRMLKMAVDVSIASSEFFKATRAFGIAYADGLEKALATGMTPAAAKKAAKEYAQARFTPDGAFKDEDLAIRAAEAPFQSVFDGSTMTGRAGQWVENIRNSPEMEGFVSVVARGAIPFFRTLANIGGSGAQYIMPPGVATGLKKFYPEGTGVAKFLDDFTGKNGKIAQQTAVGRQRMGMALVGAGFALTQIPGVEITGPSRGQRWDAKKRSFEEYPASSLIIGNESFDLSRFLPFSAPLMLVGVLRDYQLEDSLRMEGGEFDPTSGTLEWLMRYGQGSALTAALLLQDAGAARGVFDFADAVAAAVQDGDFSGLQRFGQSYAQQFTPGPIRMSLRSSGKVQNEGYGFWDKWAASAGFPTQWERLDFFGNPIRYPLLKGVDPSNRRILRLDDPAYREFAMLNRFEGMALNVAKPDGIFDKTFWRKVGLDPDDPLGFEVPSLTEMKLTDGKNAWLHYRELLYKGRAAEDVTKATGQYGDKVSVGKVLIRKGDNFEQTMRRLIDLEGYKSMTPDARRKAWEAVFGHFKKAAKDEVADNLVIDPSLFKPSRYGSPISKPEVLSTVEAEGKKLAASVQTTRGNPLDELFAIQE
jgi:hypothetical protein